MTWVLAVFRLMFNFAAICGLLAPCTTSSSTSISRSVRQMGDCVLVLDWRSNACTKRVPIRRVMAISPVVTPRISPKISSASMLLSRYPTAPFCTAWHKSSSLSEAVRSTMEISGISAWIRRVASSPSPSGMYKSIKIKSGCSWRAWSKASLPPPASPTTCSTSGRVFIRLVKPWRKMRWSYTTSTRIGSIKLILHQGNAQDHRGADVRQRLHRKPAVDAFCPLAHGL